MTNISDLPEEIRRFVRKIIRAHCKKNQVYVKGHVNGVGPEQTEETIERLLDEKKLVIETNGDEQDPTFRIIPR